MDDSGTEFVATLYPAWKAAQTKPTDVLRYECHGGVGLLSPAGRLQGAHCRSTDSLNDPLASPFLRET